MKIAPRFFHTLAPTAPILARIRVLNVRGGAKFRIAFAPDLSPFSSNLVEIQIDILRGLAGSMVTDQDVEAGMSGAVVHVAVGWPAECKRMSIRALMVRC